jgi:asparagine synthase (glutamine-hydrolysing)
MCGITGIYAFNQVGRFFMVNLSAATLALADRGPDAQKTFVDDAVGLGHRRLSIIDLSSQANQPMSDPSGRYTIVFNGECYNYKALRQDLEQKGHAFTTDSDTEVLLHLLIEEGAAGIQKVNGFFGFAFYDKQEQSILVARDRFGIKPLYYYFDEDKFAFSSTLDSLMRYNVSQEISPEALQLYLELNYVPAPLSIMKGIRKIRPGE